MQLKILLYISWIALVAPLALQAQDVLRVVGSASMYPFFTVAAERFSKTHPNAAPIVEATGTGGGFKLFCSNNPSSPQMVNASRPIQPSETALCNKQQVVDRLELALGFDALVFAHHLNFPTISLRKVDIYNALAKDIWQQGSWVENPYQYWSEVNQDLPHIPILIYGPPVSAGTRDALLELVIEPDCNRIMHNNKQAKLSKPAGVCRRLREDGVFVDSSSNDNVVIQKIYNDAQALGIVSYSYYKTHQQLVMAAAIEQITPSKETILHGQYPLARKMYSYVKGLGNSSAVLQDFVRELTSEEAIGPAGYLAAKGLLPLAAKKRATQRNNIERIIKKP